MYNIIKYIYDKSSVNIFLNMNDIKRIFLVVYLPLYTTYNLLSYKIVMRIITVAGISVLRQNITKIFFIHDYIIIIITIRGVVYHM